MSKWSDIATNSSTGGARGPRGRGRGARVPSRRPPRPRPAATAAAPALDLAGASESYGIPVEVTEGAMRELAERGLVAEVSHGARALTPAGREAAEKLVAVRRAHLCRLLEGWSPDQHEELAHLLTRLARELAAERPDTPAVAAAA